MSSDKLYKELYKRNWPIISNETQQKIKNIRVGVAGCGSTGGAVIDAFIRLGVQNYHICDNGSFEANNLNRQMVFLSDLDKNKAKVHQERILAINPESQVKSFEDGITANNVGDFLTDLDFLFDAVDVTTKNGMEMKLLLHKKAHQKKLPVASALDLGYLQWMKGYNYHLGEEALSGRMQFAEKAKHPLKMLINGFIEIEELPLELVLEVQRLIEAPEEGACQLGSACFLLSALMGPYICYFLKNNKLPNLVKSDLMEHFESLTEKEIRQHRTQEALDSLRKFLKEVS